MSEKCKAKHTKYQPSDAEWKCPKCGAKVEQFTVDSWPDEADEDCCLLHVDDVCRCFHCGNTWAGGTLAAVLEKRAKKSAEELVECPYCKGTGRVDPKTWAGK